MSRVGDYALVLTTIRYHENHKGSYNKMVDYSAGVSQTLNVSRTSVLPKHTMHDSSSYVRFVV